MDPEVRFNSGAIPPPPDYSAVPAPPDAGATAPPLSRAEQVAQGLERGAYTLPAGLARLLGASPETAEKIGGFGRSLQLSAAAPNPATLLGRMGIGGLVAGANTALDKQGPLQVAKDAAVGGLATGAVEKGAQAVRGLFSAIPHRLYSAKTGGELANWLRANVPAWAEMKGPRALYEMAREGGAGKLSDAYAEALQAAGTKVPAGTMVTVPVTVAKKAGLTIPKDLVDEAGNVAVDARGLLQALPNFAKDQAARRAVLDALDTGLPQGIIPDAALKAYRTGMGWVDFAKRGNLFKEGEVYGAVGAQKALRTVGKETLERRGMGEARDVIRGPLSQPPITKGTASTPIGALMGLLGAAGGSPLGLLGAGGGAAGAGWIGSQAGQRIPVYKNVPAVIPAIGDTRRALLNALVQSIQQAQRSTGAE